MEGKRAKNFTEQDKNTLFDIAEQFVSVIGNKKTDTTSVKEKNKAWEEITKLYNANCQSGPRFPKQLHYLYDTLKRKARQHVSDGKVELYKTGGGTFTRKTDNIDTVQDALNHSAKHLQNGSEVVPQTAPEVHTVAEVDTQTPTSAAINSDETSSDVMKSKSAVEYMAERVISRKNAKDKYEHEIHEKKVKVMTLEVAVKAREEETSILVLDHMKRCHKLIESKLEIELECAKLERQMKVNQLENIKIENELKTIDLKIKQAQYQQLKGNNDV